MPWRDRLLPASFRGARFEVESHSAEAAGRRVQVHEYPGRDTPYAEDLGRRTTEFEVTAYVVGDEYTRARDALIDACAVAGPGALSHPYLGERQVLCTGCTVTERTEEGRVARFALTFVDAGAARYPAATTDTAAALDAAGEAASAAATTDFEGAWSL